MIGHVLTFSGERGRPSTRNEFPGQFSGWSVHSGRSRMVSSSSEMRQTPPVTVKKSDADCRPAAVKSGPSRVGRQHRTSHHEEPTVHCCLLALARPQFGGYKMIASLMLGHFEPSTYESPLT